MMTVGWARPSYGIVCKDCGLVLSEFPIRQRDSRELLRYLRQHTLETEKLGVTILEKMGFTITASHTGRLSFEPYDILARKEGLRYAIDVKAPLSDSYHRSVRINAHAFEELAENPNIDVIGYLLILGEKAYLLSCKKESPSTCSIETAWT